MNQAKQNQGRNKGKRDAVRELTHGRDVTLSVGRWSRYLAAREAQAGGAFAEVLTGGDDAYDAAAWAGFSREVFAEAYGLGDTDQPLEQGEKPRGHEWVQNLHAHAKSLPEWDALCARVAGDPWAAGVAASGVISAAQDAVQAPTEDVDQLAAEKEFIQDLMDGGKTSPRHLRRMADVTRRLAAAQAEADAAAEQAQQAGAEIRTALRERIAELNGELDAMDTALRGLGAGDGSGMASRVAAPRAAVRDALQRNPKLARIAALAGRLKTRAITKQRTKVRPGAEELCDITQGNDLSRLVPSELANLAEPLTEALLYRRLMERSATCYELRGKEMRAQGPIIMVVDESGSMEGDRDELAKATAFALMEVAARQNRAFAYVRFADRVVGVDAFEKPRALKLDELLTFVTKFANGGTRIGSGLRRADDLLAAAAGPWKRADVVLVTDGASSDATEQLSAAKSIREKGAHIYGVAIGHGTSILKGVCDEEIQLTGDDSAKLDAIFAI